MLKVVVFCFCFFAQVVCAEESDFRCLISVGLKNPLSLQINFPGDREAMGKVFYKNGPAEISIKALKVEEVEPGSDGRPSEFTTTWQEIVKGDVGGKYIIVTQGAQIYGFNYIRKRDGKVFSFESDDQSMGDSQCTWRN